MLLAAEGCWSMAFTGIRRYAVRGVSFGLVWFIDLASGLRLADSSPNLSTLSIRSKDPPPQ